MKRKLFSQFAVAIFLCSIILTVPVQSSSQTDSNVKQPLSNLRRVPHPDNFFYGDARPDAPELAYRGSFNVGVRTLEVINPNQIDILKHSEENTDPRYDRPLKLEVKRLIGKAQKETLGIPKVSRELRSHLCLLSVTRIEPQSMTG